MRVIWLCLLLVLIRPILANDTQAKTAEDAGRILVLFSYSPLFPSAKASLNGLLDSLPVKNFDIDVEYLDSKHVHNSQSKEHFKQFLERKLSKKASYDLIITADDNALDFVNTYRNSLFEHLPVIFFGVNNLQTAQKMDMTPLTTGVVETISVKENLKLIRELQPSVRTIVVITDNTPSSKADLEKVLAAQQVIDSTQIKIIDTSKNSWSEFAQELRKLDQSHAILLLSSYRDKLNTHLDFDESLQILKQNTDLAIYHFWMHGLGDGIAGGVLIDHFEHAKQAGVYAKRILDGEDISNLPIVWEGPNVLHFDYAELNKLGINKKLLPDGVQLINKPFSVWNEYKLELSVLTLGLLSLASLSLYLAWLSGARKRLAMELETKAQFMKMLMDTTPDRIIVRDQFGVAISCNKTLCKHLGVDAENIVGKRNSDFMEGKLLELIDREDKRVIEQRKPRRFEAEEKDEKTGLKTYLDIYKAPLVDQTDKVIGIFTITRDVTEQRKSESKASILSQVVHQSQVVIYLLDLNGDIFYVNSKLETQTGYTEEEIIGKNFLDTSLAKAEIFTQDGRSSSLLHIIDSSQASIEAYLSTLNGEVKLKRKDGTPYWSRTRQHAIYNEHGSVECYLLVEDDITLRKNQEEEIARRAYYDMLTGLPNRSSAMSLLENLITKARNQDTSIALMYVDLDGFKKVNDSLGHDIGDKLLQQIASRFFDSLRKNDTTCRIGGDEFIVLLDEVESTEQIQSIAKKINSALSKPFFIDQRELQISSSIGIALYPQDCSSLQELFRYADAAMYASKREGGNTYAFFTQSINESAQRRFELEEQLHSALDRKEFYLVYQPQVDLKRNAVTGMEVLLRWNNCKLGNIPPDEFIPIAESSGAITNIGRFVIDQATKEISALNFAEPLHLAINFSPRQFREPSLLDFIRSTTSKNQYSLDKIEVEITEGVLLDKGPNTKSLLEKMHRIGLHLSLDDFGTGYASMSYLRQYPFSSLKIDREFINGIEKNKADQELVQAIISLAKGLDIRIIAEGVETAEQANILEEWDCDLAQGYYFSRPVQADKLIEVVANLNQKPIEKF